MAVEEHENDIRGCRTDGRRLCQFASSFLHNPKSAGGKSHARGTFELPAPDQSVHSLCMEYVKSTDTWREEFKTFICCFYSGHGTPLCLSPLQGYTNHVAAGEEQYESTSVYLVLEVRIRSSRVTITWSDVNTGLAVRLQHRLENDNSSNSLIMLIQYPYAPPCFSLRGLKDAMIPKITIKKTP